MNTKPEEIKASRAEKVNVKVKYTLPETMNKKEEEEEGRKETHSKFKRESHQNTPNPLSPTNTPTSDQQEIATTLETQSQPEADTQHRSNHHTQTVSNRNAKNDDERKAEYETRDNNYNVDTKTIDFRNHRPTDLPFNKQLFLPKSDRNREESEEEIQIAYLSFQLQKATN